MPSHRTLRPLAAVLGLGLVLAGDAGAGEGGGDVPAGAGPAGALAGEPGAQEIGAALYGQFCAGCHGAEGRGDGPLAPLISAQMPDLTRLSAANEGVFPMLEVVHTIDGRTRLAAHGGPMPVWGAVFGQPAQLRVGLHGSPLEAHGRIMALTLHLEAMQE